jgi:predicted metal-dependent phosphotriesterase family hydrolase
MVREARKRGVRGIVVTHALLAPVSMTVEQARQAAAEGAFVEFVGNAMIGTTRSVTFAAYVEAMRGAGIDRAILSSDLGQANNPLHPDGLETIFAGLRAAGMTVDEIDRVAKRNPARLLGLE